MKSKKQGGIFTFFANGCKDYVLNKFNIAAFIIFLFLLLPVETSFLVSGVYIDRVNVSGSGGIAGLLSDSDTLYMNIYLKEATSIGNDDVSIRIQENSQNPSVQFDDNPQSCTYYENDVSPTDSYTLCKYATSASSFPLTEMAYSVSGGTNFKLGQFNKDYTAPQIINFKTRVNQQKIDFMFSATDTISATNPACSGFSKVEIIDNLTKKVLHTVPINAVNDAESCSYDMSFGSGLNLTLDYNGERELCLVLYDGVGNKASACQNVLVDLIAPQITSFTLYGLDIHNQISKPIRYFSNNTIKNVLVEMNISDTNIPLGLTGNVWADMQQFAPPGINPISYNISLDCQKRDDSGYRCTRLISHGIIPHSLDALNVPVMAGDSSGNSMSMSYRLPIIIDTIPPEVVDITTDNCVTGANSDEQICFLNSEQLIDKRNKIIVRFNDDLSGVSPDTVLFELGNINSYYNNKLIVPRDCKKDSGSSWECTVLVEPSMSQNDSAFISMSEYTKDIAGNSLSLPKPVFEVIYDGLSPNLDLDYESPVEVKVLSNSEYPALTGYDRKVVIPYDELEVTFHVYDAASGIKSVLLQEAGFNVQSSDVIEIPCDPDPEFTSESLIPNHYICKQIISEAHPPARSTTARKISFMIVDGAGNIKPISNYHAYDVARFENTPASLQTTVSLYSGSGIGTPIPALDKNLFVAEFNPAGYTLQIPIIISGVEQVFGLRADTCNIVRVGSGAFSKTVPVINNPDFYLTDANLANENQDKKVFLINLPPLAEDLMENATAIYMNCSISYLVGSSYGSISNDKLSTNFEFSIPLRGSLGDGPGQMEYEANKAVQDEIDELVTFLDTAEDVLQWGMDICSGLQIAMTMVGTVRQIVYATYIIVDGIAKVIPYVEPAAAALDTAREAMNKFDSKMKGLWDGTIDELGGSVGGFLGSTLSLHNVCRFWLCDYGVSWYGGDDSSDASLWGPQDYTGALKTADEVVSSYLTDMLDVKKNEWTAWIVPPILGLSNAIGGGAPTFYPPCFQGIVRTRQHKLKMLIAKKACLNAHSIDQNSYICDQYEKYHECVYGWGFLGKITYLLKSMLVDWAMQFMLDNLSALVYKLFCDKVKNEDSHTVFCSLDYVIAGANLIDGIGDIINEFEDLFDLFSDDDTSNDEAELTDEIDELDELDL